MQKTVNTQPAIDKAYLDQASSGVIPQLNQRHDVACVHLLQEQPL